MSKLLKLSNLHSSKQLLLSLEGLVQLNQFKQQNDHQFQSILSRLRKSDKEKKQEADLLARKNKIKKNKKNNKKKTQKVFNYQQNQSSQVTNKFLDYLRCEQDLIEQNYTIFRNKLLQSQDYLEKDEKQLRLNENQMLQDVDQDQMLQDFTADLIQNICYEKHRRKSLLQLEAKEFMRILIKIQTQFELFMDRINQSGVNSRMGFREKKINQSKMQNQFIQQILLSIPEIKEVLQNFQEKYCSDQYYKNQYRQLLTKKKIIYSIKKIIDRQNESEEEEFCSSHLETLTHIQKMPEYKINLGFPSPIKDFQYSAESQYWSQTEQIYSILNRKTQSQTQKQYFSYNWQDMKARLKDFSIKIEEQMNQTNKKSRKKNQKKKKALESLNKLNCKQQIDEDANKLSDFLEKLEIDHSRTLQCRLEDGWMDQFKKKNIEPYLPKQQMQATENPFKNTNKKTSFEYKDF